MTYLDPTTVPVPSADSADNNYFQDVIGNKTDTSAGDSIFAHVHTLEEHVHSAQKVYPTLSPGIAVAAGVGAWTLGDFFEIVAASTITSVFDIHYLSIEAITANDVYELVLYKGALASEIEVGRVRFSKSAAQEGTENQPFQTIIIAANERISAKLASATGSNNVTTGIIYHTY